MHDSLAKFASLPRPDDRTDLLARLKSEALILRDSQGWGAPLIHRELSQRHPNAKFSQRTVSNWIARPADDVSPPETRPWKKWEPTLWQQDAGYLLRLDLITKTIHRRGLNELEATWATRLEVALGGLNLFAQWALIDEYAARGANSADPITDDLDLIVATRPWADDGELFRAAAETRVIDGGYVASIRALRLRSEDCGDIWALMPAELLSSSTSSVLTYLTPKYTAGLINSLPTDAVGIRLAFEIGIALHQGIEIVGQAIQHRPDRVNGDPGDAADERSSMDKSQLNRGPRWERRLMTLWQQLGSRSSHRPLGNEQTEGNQHGNP